MPGLGVCYEVTCDSVCAHCLNSELRGCWSSEIPDVIKAGNKTDNSYMKQFQAITNMHNMEDTPTFISLSLRYNLVANIITIITFSCENISYSSKHRIVISNFYDHPGLYTICSTYIPIVLLLSSSAGGAPSLQWSRVNLMLLQSPCTLSACRRSCSCSCGCMGFTSSTDMWQSLAHCAWCNCRLTHYGTIKWPQLQEKSIRINQWNQKLWKFSTRAFIVTPHTQ